MKVWKNRKITQETPKDYPDKPEIWLVWTATVGEYTGAKFWSGRVAGTAEEAEAAYQAERRNFREVVKVRYQRESGE